MLINYFAPNHEIILKHKAKLITEPIRNKHQPHFNSDYSKYNVFVINFNKQWARINRFNIKLEMASNLIYCDDVSEYWNKSNKIHTELNINIKAKI